VKARRAWPALLLVAAFASAGCAAQCRERHAPPHDEYHASDFDDYFDDLAAYGTWVDIPPYGWVWCPLDTPIGWRPYTVGYWVYSDEGWLWMSEDPWGWVPYHYGRWAWDRNYGWVWVPDDVWAPAWVAWRYGDGWIGWAPLPPDVHWRVGIGLMYAAYDLDRHINRHRWCFVPTHDFGPSRERVRVRVEPMSRNVSLLKGTRNVTKYVAGPRPVETGMDPSLFRKRGQPPFERHRVVDSPTPIRERGATLRDKTVEVYRPRGQVTAVVRERVKNVAPEKRPVAPPALIEKMERRRARLDEAVKDQRGRLQESQQEEMRNRPPGESAVELKRSQEAELRAQREVEEREKRVVEERERRAIQQRERAEREAERDARLRGSREKVAKEREANSRAVKERQAKQQEAKQQAAEERATKEREQKEAEKREPPKNVRDPRSRDRGR